MKKLAILLSLVLAVPAFAQATKEEKPPVTKQAEKKEAKEVKKANKKDAKDVKQAEKKEAKEAKQANKKDAKDVKQAEKKEAKADKGRPEGATAKCKDGTYSSSKTRQGACSSHGGVAEWF